MAAKSQGKGDARPRRKRRRSIDPIDVINEKSDQNFMRDHFRPGPSWNSWRHPQTKAQYSLSLVCATQLPPPDLEVCYSLVERTSRADYEASTIGWSRVAKMQEMESPELKYLLVRYSESDSGEEGVDSGATKMQEREESNRPLQEKRLAENDSRDDGITNEHPEKVRSDEKEKNQQGKPGEIRAFASMMPTWENGEPVLYCYEIHCREELRGTSLSHTLMNHLITTATNTPPITKVMLTCFVRNARALRFYEKLGFEKDGSSPPTRTLRGGRVVEPDHVFLSRPV